MCFFFNDTATTEIYTLSLHDALPIFGAFMPILTLHTSMPPTREPSLSPSWRTTNGLPVAQPLWYWRIIDRKSTRLNSSHANISYAVFCLQKKRIITPLHCSQAHMSVL